jgi:hypothetical protein
MGHVGYEIATLLTVVLGKVCINHAGIELPNMPSTATIWA